MVETGAIVILDFCKFERFIERLVSKFGHQTPTTTTGEIFFAAANCLYRCTSTLRGYNTGMYGSRANFTLSMVPFEVVAPYLERWVVPRTFWWATYCCGSRTEWSTSGPVQTAGLDTVPQPIPTIQLFNRSTQTRGWVVSIRTQQS